MSKRTIGILLLIAGIVIVLVALFAGYIGLSQSTSIGLRKELLALVGVIVGVVGVVLMVRK